jgi:hypothetical protein
MALEELGQVELVDEGIAALQRLDLALVVVDADDLVTHFSETYGGDEADVAGTDYGYLQVFSHGLAWS